MPIGGNSEYSKEHWADVKSIIFSAIEESGFRPGLVSDADDSGIIQKTIVQNLYNNTMVVADVSSKNPNVMFELGMRLAFDKPTIIIKDDKTDYSFDTGQIEHLCYPRDLRFQTILDFKEKLKEKIIGTHKEATTNLNYTTFLKHFGSFKVAQLDEKTVGKDEYLYASLEEMKDELRKLRINTRVKQRKVDLPDDVITDSIVENRIKDFLMEKGLKNIFQVGALGLESECFNFIEKFEEVRYSCGSPEGVHAAIKRCIDKDI